MSEATHSLILSQESEDDSQLCLTLGDVPKIDRSKPKFDYTGERLFRDRPEIYKAVVMLIAEPGISQRQICRICHVTDNTVNAVAAREGIPIAAHKKIILGTFRQAQRLLGERVLELAPTMGAKDAIIGLGVVTEKVELLTGGATQRVETVSGGADIFEQFRQFHDKVEKMANAREVGPKALDNGSEGENLPANGAACGDGTATAASDAESDARASESQASNGATTSNDATSAGESRTESSLPDGGGRGSELDERCPKLTGNTSQNFYDKGDSQ